MHEISQKSEVVNASPSNTIALTKNSNGSALKVTHGWPATQMSIGEVGALNVHLALVRGSAALTLSRCLTRNFRNLVHRGYSTAMVIRWSWTDTAKLLLSRLSTKDGSIPDILTTSSIQQSSLKRESGMTGIRRPFAHDVALLL
jgi:hypothetical protein